MYLPSLETIVQLTGSYGPFLGVALATFLLLDTIFRTIARKRRESSAINGRLRVLEAKGDSREALVELRRKRGLSPDGGYILPIIALNRLLLQSGLEIRLSFLIFSMLALACIAGVSAKLLGVPLPPALLTGFAVGTIFPLLILVRARSGRMRLLEEQLPEAVDVMVRSLRAGHPIPVSIAMVGREMSDPVGSEFGMVGDEMTYGLDLTTAMGNLRERTGQMDVALLAVAVSIQGKTGGNLAEMLSKLGRMIRERYRVRRKIRALSAEGRFSSIALIIIPLVLIALVNTLTPSFYGGVKDDPIFMPMVYLGLMLWLVGTYVIRRMVNFKF